MTVGAEPTGRLAPEPGTSSIIEDVRAQGYRFPPLPATADEVRAIAQILNVPALAPHVLLGADATKRALLY